MKWLFLLLALVCVSTVQASIAQQNIIDQLGYNARDVWIARQSLNYSNNSCYGSFDTAYCVAQSTTAIDPRRNEMFADLCRIYYNYSANPMYQNVSALQGCLLAGDWYTYNQLPSNGRFDAGTSSASALPSIVYSYVVGELISEYPASYIGNQTINRTFGFSSDFTVATNAVFVQNSTLSSTRTYGSVTARTLGAGNVTLRRNSSLTLDLLDINNDSRIDINGTAAITYVEDFGDLLDGLDATTGWSTSNSSCAPISLQTTNTKQGTGALNITIYLVSNCSTNSNINIIKNFNLSNVSGNSVGAWVYIANRSKYLDDNFRWHFQNQTNGFSNFKYYKFFNNSWSDGWNYIVFNGSDSCDNVTLKTVLINGVSKSLQCFQGGTINPSTGRIVLVIQGNTSKNSTDQVVLDDIHIINATKTPSLYYWNGTANVRVEMPLTGDQGTVTRTVNIPRGALTDTNRQIPLFYVNTTGYNLSLVNASWSADRSNMWLNTATVAAERWVTKRNISGNGEYDAQFWSNQISIAALGFHYLYNLTGNSTYLEVRNDAMDKLLVAESQGVWGEQNQALLSADANAHYVGLASVYQDFSMAHAAKIHALTGNQSILNALNRSMNLYSYLLINNGSNANITKQSGFYTRGGVWTSSFVFYNESSNCYSMSPMTAYAAYYLSQFDDTAKRIAQVMNGFTLCSGPGDIAQNYGQHYYVEAYNAYSAPTSSSRLYFESTGRAYKHYNESRLIFLRLPSYSIALSYGNATPAGVIADMYDSNGKHYVASKGNDNPFKGLGVINDSQFSNVYDVDATVQFNSTYPYRIVVSGNLTNTSLYDSGIPYQTNYTFYDSYIRISQSVGGNVTMQFSPLSLGTIGTGVINESVPKVIGNLSYLVAGLNTSFNDSTQTSAYGEIESVSTMGATFSYYVAPINTTGTQVFDQLGVEIGLPISYQQGTNGGAITNLLEVEARNVSVTANTSLVASNPRITQSNGSISYPSYSTGNQSITFDLSILSGVANLSIDTVNASIEIQIQDTEIVKGISHSYSHTAEDENGVSCYSWLEQSGTIYGSNESVACNSTSSFNVNAAGNYTLVLYAIDGAGNANSERALFAAQDSQGGTDGGSGGTINPSPGGGSSGSSNSNNGSNNQSKDSEYLKYAIVAIALILIISARGNQ